MKIEKVAVPREVAEAIDHLRTITNTNHGMMYVVQYGISPEARKVHEWAFAVGRAGSPDLLMQALVVGYEVDKTPEEKVREYYESTRGQYGEMYGVYARSGVTKTLDLLGIKIGGVNA